MIDGFFISVLIRHHCYNSVKVSFWGITIKLRALLSTFICTASSGNADVTSTSKVPVSVRTKNIEYNSNIDNIKVSIRSKLTLSSTINIFLIFYLSSLFKFEALDPARSPGCCPGVGVAKHSLKSEDPSNNGTGGVSENIL